MRIVLALLAAVVVGSACVNDPAQMDCPQQVPPGFGPSPLRVALADVTASILVRAQCRKRGLEVSGVTVIVHDQSGESVPFTFTEPIKEYETFATRVDFVPKVGASTITASFQPELGTVEVAVVGMRDRSGEAPVQDLVVPEDCNQLALAGGLFACGGSNLRVYLDGGLLEEVPSAGLRAGGEVLWTWNASGVSRWQGTQRVQLGTPSSLGFAVSLGADEGRLLVDQQGELWQFVATDGGAALSRETLMLDAGAIRFRHPALPVDGGWLITDEQQVCFASVASAPRCAPFVHTVLGAEGDGFWVNDGNRLGFIRFQGEGLSPSSAVYLNQPLLVESGSSGLPRLSWGEWRVTVRPDTLEMEAWPSFPGGVRVTPTHYVGVTGSKHFTVFRR